MDTTELQIKSEVEKLCKTGELVIQKSHTASDKFSKEIASLNDQLKSISKVVNSLSSMKINRANQAIKNDTKLYHDTNEVSRGEHAMMPNAGSRPSMVTPKNDRDVVNNKSAA